MPHKLNEGRRHKFPKVRYRVTNWPDYDAALVRRGELTVWLTEEAIASWYAPATGERGGQPIYSAIAIETALTLRLVFHQPLRQTEGLLRSIAALLGIDIAIPDHTTLSRRGGGIGLQRHAYSFGAGAALIHIKKRHRFSQSCRVRGTLSGGARSRIAVPRSEPARSGPFSDQSVQATPEVTTA